MTREQAGWLKKYITKDDDGLKKTVFLETLQSRIDADISTKNAKKTAKKAAAA